MFISWVNHSQLIRIRVNNQIFNRDDKTTVLLWMANISLTTLPLHSNQKGINWPLVLYQNILFGFIKAKRSTHNKFKLICTDTKLKSTLVKIKSHTSFCLPCAAMLNCHGKGMLWAETPVSCPIKTRVKKPSALIWELDVSLFAEKHFSVFCFTYKLNPVHCKKLHAF